MWYGEGIQVSHKQSLCSSSDLLKDFYDEAFTDKEWAQPGTAESALAGDLIPD